MLRHNLRLAVVAPSDPPEFFDLVWEGVWSATFELSPFGVDVDTFKTAGHDLAAQKSILTNLLDSNYAAIALLPAHVSGLNDLIKCHTSNGTRVVTFNTDAPDSSRLSFVGPDARQGGALSGELLAKLMFGKGNLICFPGLLNKQNFADRYAGLREELRCNAPALQEIACHEGLNNLESAATSLFSRHPDVSGVYVGSSQVFQVGAVLQRMGLRVPCVGFNNTEAVRPYLKDGWVSALIEESAHQQGYMAIQRAYEAALAVDIGARPEWVRVPTTVVFRANSLDSSCGESLNDAFELLIRQRTTKLRSYQEQLENANAKLLHLAETDALTGLLNRRKFEELVDDQMALAAPHTVRSLLMVDLDSFKAYNDSYGHHVGDEALRTVARVLESCCRAGDFCARLGGDEFCLLLPGADSQIAHEIKSRIQAAMENVRIAPQTLNLRVRLSIGIASMPEEALTWEDLIVAADRAMYAEKRMVERRENREYAAPL